MTRCFICGDHENTINLIGTVHVCPAHAEGTAAPYTEAAP